MFKETVSTLMLGSEGFFKQASSMVSGCSLGVMGWNGVLSHVCLWLEPYHLKSVIAPPATTHTPGFCSGANGDSKPYVQFLQRVSRRWQLSFKQEEGYRCLLSSHTSEAALSHLNALEGRASGPSAESTQSSGCLSGPCNWNHGRVLLSPSSLFSEPLLFIPVQSPRPSFHNKVHTPALTPCKVRARTAHPLGRT